MVDMYRGPMSDEELDFWTEFLQEVCPKCRTVIDPIPEHPEPGECQNCGNTYWWDEGLKHMVAWEEE